MCYLMVPGRSARVTISTRMPGAHALDFQQSHSNLCWPLFRRLGSSRTKIVRQRPPFVRVRLRLPISTMHRSSCAVANRCRVAMSSRLCFHRVRSCTGRHRRESRPNELRILCRAKRIKDSVSREAATQSWVGLNPGTDVAIGVLIGRRRVTRVRRVFGAGQHVRSAGTGDGDVSGERDLGRRR